MRVPLDLSIALRYLLKRQGGGFLTVIATIAVLGIAVGVMALFIALGLMTGLQGEIRGRILGATAHVSVFKSRGEPFDNPTGIAAKVGGLPGVLGAAPAFYGQALISSPSSQRVATIKGISGAGIQAPSVNFEITTMRAITPVVTAPTPLITMLSFHRGSRCLRWWRTMPVWLRVNPVNTPKA